MKNADRQIGSEPGGHSKIAIVTLRLWLDCVTVMFRVYIHVLLKPKQKYYIDHAHARGVITQDVKVSYDSEHPYVMSQTYKSTSHNSLPIAGTWNILDYTSQFHLLMLLLLFRKFPFPLFMHNNIKTSHFHLRRTQSLSTYCTDRSVGILVAV